MGRLRQIKTTSPPYVILVTNRSNKEDLIEGLDSGADDYISKPFDNDELRTRINVGRRIIDLQDALLEKEKLQGVIEMAGAVCHDLNQPLMAISGFSEILLMNTSEDNPQYPNIRNIQEQVERMGKITRRLMNITRYKTKAYL